MDINLSKTQRDEVCSHCAPGRYNLSVDSYNRREHGAVSAVVAVLEGSPRWCKMELGEPRVLFTAECC